MPVSSQTTIRSARESATETGVGKLVVVPHAGKWKGQSLEILISIKK
jgi:hypothetical protein